MRKINRRKFLKVAMTAAGASLVSCKSENPIIPETGPASSGSANTIFIPMINGSPSSTPQPAPTNTPKPAPTPPGTGPKVIHVHAANATSWDFSTGWYGNYVNQSVVNNMVDEGVKQLTGKTVVSEAWQTLLPGYSAGKRVAIKVNLNNAQCNDADNRIDALIELINAMVKSMKMMGVNENDIWVYDASRTTPTRFISRCLYSGVVFWVPTGFSCSGATETSFSSLDPNAQITFSAPALSPRKIPNALIDATYLINIPILKDHGISGVTLGFKNHLGTIQYVIKPGDQNDSLHYYIDPNDAHYNASANPLVEIFSNPHIRSKTVLTIGDGLFGAFGGSTNNDPPAQWQSFGNNAPNSLFFSADPVAIDCVMMDILDNEPAYHPKRPQADEYLKNAALKGYGIYERGAPSGLGYSQINYIKREI